MIFRNGDYVVVCDGVSEVTGKVIAVDPELTTIDVQFPPNLGKVRKFDFDGSLRGPNEEYWLKKN